MNLACGSARAALGLIALFMLGETGGQNDRAIDQADDFEDGDVRRPARQTVAAMGPCSGFQEALLGQFLQDFGEQRQRDTVAVGDFLGAGAVPPCTARCFKAINPYRPFLVSFSMSDK